MRRNDTELGVIWQIISVPRSSAADTRRFNGLPHPHGTGERGTNVGDLINKLIETILRREISLPISIVLP